MFWNNVTDLRQSDSVQKKMEPLKKAQHNKAENVAGSVWLSLFMDGGGMCKLPSMPPSTGLSSIQHLMIILNVEFKTSTDVFIR